MPEATQFSIVVVAYESAGPLAGLVSSMNRHLDSSVELVVVDNASAERPDEAVRGWEGPWRLIRLDSNHGFGTAANVGVAKASHDAVVILNPDTELIDSSVGDLAAAALAEGALLGPRVFNRDGSVQPSASGPPVGPWAWVRALTPPVGAPRALVARTHPWRLESATDVAWLTGCAVAGPRRALAALGPFDTRIHMYGEDMDLGLRAGAAGIPSRIVPGTAALIHDGKASTELVSGDLGRGAAGQNGRTILAQAYGPRRERLAWMAERAGLRIRVIAKSILRRDATWDRLVLAGLRRATPGWDGAVKRSPEVAEELVSG